MGINQTEEKILKELEQLSQEKEDETPPQEILKEAEEEIELPPLEDKEEEDSLPLPDEEAAQEEIEQESPQEEEKAEAEEEEEEKELAPAKMRHKLKAEKEKNEQLEARLREIELAQARAEGAREAAQEAPPEKVEEIPDMELEPEKYAIWEAQQAKKEVQSLKQELERTNAERQWETFQSEYAKVHPDYQAAKDFLIQHEATQIKMLYPSATDMQIAQHMRQQEHVIVANAAKAGIDPAQHIEFLAYQAGFRADKKKDEEKKELPKQKPNLDKIKKNVKKNASLIGGSPAGDAGDARSAEQLLTMSLEDIDKFGTDKYEKAIQKVAARLG